MTEANETSARRSYQAGVAVASVTSFLTVWTTIVRDDGNGIGFFLLIMAAGVGGFAASFRAAGMARTMAGVAIMQLTLGLAIATAPVTASIPGAVARILLFTGISMTLWLVSAAFFRTAARRDQETAAA
ncbi:hypothetical protein MZO42_19330 [Sphingomonas psychrotolerans]|uniref:Uncharacterized protein n=1 Tax=Sphingomonas psychrotolerans TaxID=1327635 RepID=A0ABU3N8M0_9SPHN|nr:hypothetical protein [Sphingomonas psychrotolerans]MDT8760858.1 hypothetical protein [Sphingomonas psychrotolerans]